MHTAPFVDAIPLIIEPRGRPDQPRKSLATLHADTAYKSSAFRHARRSRGISLRIVRRGRDSSERLGRDQWVTERSLSWLLACRQLGVRYERRADMHRGLLHMEYAVLCLCFLGTVDG